MKVTHIGHAALLVETGGLRIVTDPWFHGSAYCDQWFLFPPADDDVVKTLDRVDHVLISHGHEDHVHTPSLQRIDPSAGVHFPYSWYGGAVDHFQELGFEEVIEAVNGKRYRLNEQVAVTFLANNLDNVIVIEGDGQVLVDVNDALTSAPVEVIDHFIQLIRQRWPKVDMLFSTYGGASYFPNTIKSPWKDDEEVARVRERFFLDHFCRIANGIGARYSVPFASDFVLLDDDQRWMNRTRTLRKDIPAYHAEHAPGPTTILECYPGDRITADGIEERSNYHSLFRTQDIDVLIREVHDAEIARKRAIAPISLLRFADLVEELRKHVIAKVHIVPASARKALRFAVRITDHADASCILVDVTDDAPEVTVIDHMPSVDLEVHLKSATLHHSLTEEWGGDAIVIGYGCTIHVRSRACIEQELDNWAVHLLTHYPNTKEYIRREPLRAFNYLLHDGIKRRKLMSKAMGSRNEAPFIDPLLKDHSLWLTRSNCDICKKCNLPVMADEREAAEKAGTT